MGEPRKLIPNKDIPIANLLTMKGTPIGKAPMRKGESPTKAVEVGIQAKNSPSLIAESSIYDV